SYTLLGFYSGSFAGPARYVYALAFVLLCWLLGHRLQRWLHAASARPALGWAALATALPVVPMLLLGFDASSLEWQDEGRKARRALPNILILSSDGINASNMSAYGYERD